MNNQRRPGGGSGGRHGALLTLEKPKNIKKTLGRLVKYIGSNKYLFFVLLLFTFIVTVLQLVGPYLQGEAMGVITITDEQPEINWDTLLSLLFGMALTYAFLSVFTYFQSVFSAKLSQSTVVKMRNDLFGHIVKLPISYIDTHQHGDIMSRMTNDVDKISNTISSSISSLFSGVLTIIGVLAITLYLNWFLTIVSLSSVFLTVIVVKYLSRLMRKFFKKQQFRGKTIK